MSLVTLVVMEYAQLYCICGVTGTRKITRSNYSEVTSCQGRTDHYLFGTCCGTHDGERSERIGRLSTNQ